jgi:GAF domain-containing protein
MRMVQKEQWRLAAVERFRHFEFDLNDNIQGLLKLATDIYETPVAFITLIDEHDQWFKANRGFDVMRMPRDTSFCTHAILDTDVMVVNDAVADNRFINNPLVAQPPYIRFYAGAPMASNDGQNVGTLCVMDVCAKDVPDNKKQLLRILAQQAIHLMELKLAYKLLNEKIDQVEVQNKALLDIAFIQSHEFRGPLASVMGMVNLIKYEGMGAENEYLFLLEEAVNKLDERIHVVVKSTEIARAAYVK